MAKKGVSRKDRFKGGPLYLGKVTLQVLCRKFTESKLSYEEAVALFTRLMPWFADEYLRVNGMPLDFMDKAFRGKVEDNARRRRNFKGVGKATAVEEIAVRIITKGQPTTLDEIKAMNIEHVMRTVQVNPRYLYSLPINKNDLREGSKIGKTGKPAHRMFQIQHATQNKSYSIGAPYDMVLEFAVDDTKIRALEKRAKALCKERGAKAIDGLDFLDCSAAMATWAMQQTALEEELEFKDVTDYWNNTFRDSNIVLLRKTK
jgi:hypothetical protein